MEEKHSKISKVLALLIMAPIILAVITTIVATFIAMGNQGDMEAIDAGIVSLMPYILMTNHALLFLLLLLFIRADGMTLGSIGWQLPDNKGALWLEPLIGMVLGIVLFLFYNLAISPAIELTQHIIGDYQSGLVAYTGRDRILWLIVVTIVAGIVEESIYRGYAIRRLSLRMGTGWALVLSSLLFGPLHWGQGLWSVVGSMIFGLLLGGIFLWRRNLLAPAIAHAILNLLIEF